MASSTTRKSLRRSALVVAMGICFAGGVQAQSTTGNVYGSAPAGTTVTVKNASGLTRTVTADASGRFNVNTLPVGKYTVTVQRDGTNVATREVTVLAGAGTDASFVSSGGSSTSDGGSLDVVTVQGSSVPTIDSTAIDTRSIVTADQLERLPLARSAEAIALLAPGAVSGAAGFFGGLVSFGGAGVSENAYYVNGYFTGEPVSNLGGFTLPWGAIEQQETFIGGYSAKYGRSDGGVISQIGKRGTNEWHFGGQVTYTPKSLRGETDDVFFPNVDFSAANDNPNLPSTCGASGNELCQWEYTDPTRPGTTFSRGKDQTSWSHAYNLYAGGPIIKDRLFFFAAGEMTDADSRANPSRLGTQRTVHTNTKTPRLYGKLDWNITDNHLLELTYLGEKTDQTGEFYTYNFATGDEGAKLATVPDPFLRKNQYAIAKYTGYLTDNLTLSVLYGQSKQTREQINPSIIPGLALIGSPTLQNPALNGGTPRTNTQGGAVGIDSENKTDGIRADLEWVLGDHTLTVGVDNIKFESINEGQDQLVDRFIYGRTTNAIVGGVVGSPASATNPNGYYVQQLVFRTATSMELDQKAWYLEDRWQVTDNFLLSLGIRNDQFTNSNNFGEKYLDAKNQWAPRIGFAWDVNGDSTFKVFGNAGRYFLAMPNNVAIRGASASTFTRHYFNYTGIDANGVPTGLTEVPRLDGGSGPFSSNGEYGQPIDVLSFAPSDLKNMYQDEYILGFEHMFTDRWMVGVKMTKRDLKSAIDDICDAGRMASALEARGIDSGSVEIPGCFMFNPGGTNNFSLKNVDGSGRTTIAMSPEDWGFVNDMKRKYTGLDIYLERPFDGKWEARLDYTYSKSHGNMEGQVKSEFGQANISKTQDWDAAEIMAFADGYLANDRRHQLKARGSFQLTSELLVGANLRIASGGPISCLGLYNPDGSIDENTEAADPIHYGASYHTCFGETASPGSKRNPWTKTIDLGLTYRPSFADDKLAFGVQVRNVLNDQETLQVDVTSEDDAYTVSNTYLMPIGRQTPRTVVFTASYDW